MEVIPFAPKNPSGYVNIYAGMDWDGLYEVFGVF